MSPSDVRRRRHARRTTNFDPERFARNRTTLRHLGLLGLALGCGASPPPSVPMFAVTFVTESDPGVPLAGVEVLANGQSQGESGPEGLIQTTLRGEEGAAVEIRYVCPEGHRDSESEETLRLHDFRGLDEDRGSGLRKHLRCPPKRRRAAFVVRTHGEAGLPILLDGQEVAVTNAQGIAHIVLRSRPHTLFELRIGTGARPTLRPQNPLLSFRLEDEDEIFVFDQAFEEERPRRRRRRSRGRSRSRMRIQRL